MGMNLNKTERSLLLFFETCAVDHGGLVGAKHMNSEDRAYAKIWNSAGYVRFGRVVSRECSLYSAYWCSLSDEAWDDAHAERRARAKRMNEGRTWKTTEE